MIPGFAKIVEELVDNAFKFSEPGSIVCVESSVESGQLHLTISDQGLGLSLDTLGRDDSAVVCTTKIREHSGIGLGLSIARQLTELYGGTFQMNESFSNHTVVQVTLPLA